MMNGRSPNVSIFKQIHYQRFRFGAENRCGRRKNDEIMKVKVTDVPKGSKMRVFCVKPNGTIKPPFPHPNTLGGASCQAGVYCHPVFQHDVISELISIPWLQINRTKKEKMVAELEKRKELLPPEFIDGYEAVLNQLRRREEQIKTTDVHLCVHLTVPGLQTGQFYSTYAVSSLIKHDEKGTCLKIDSLSKMSGSVRGHDLIHIFTKEDSPAIEPDEVQIHMEERDNNGQVLWSSPPFLAGKNDVRYKHVIFYPVPPYANKDITQAITVRLVVRYRDTDLEDSIAFIYEPTVEAVKLWQGKRKPLSPQTHLPFKYLKLDELNLKSQLPNGVMQRSVQFQELQGLCVSTQGDQTTSSPSLLSQQVQGIPVTVPLYLSCQPANMASSLGTQAANNATSMNGQGFDMVTSMGDQTSNIATTMGGQGSIVIGTSMGGQGSNIATFIGGQGCDMVTSMFGQGLNVSTSIGDQGSNISTAIDRQGSVMGDKGSNVASSTVGKGFDMASSIGGQALTNTALLQQGQGFAPAKRQALTNTALSFARPQDMEVTGQKKIPAAVMTPNIVTSEPGSSLRGDDPTECTQEWQSGQPYTVVEELPGTQTLGQVEGSNLLIGTDDNAQQGNESEGLSYGIGGGATSKEPEETANAPRLTRIKLAQERSDNQGYIRSFIRWPTPEEQVSGTKEPLTIHRPNVDKLEMMRRLQEQRKTSTPSPQLTEEHFETELLEQKNSSIPSPQLLDERIQTELQEQRNCSVPDPHFSEEHFQTGGDPNQTEAVIPLVQSSSHVQETEFNDTQDENLPGSNSQMFTESQNGTDVEEAPFTIPPDTPVSPPGQIIRRFPSNLTIPTSPKSSESGHTPSSTGSLSSIHFPLNLNSVDLLKDIDIGVFDKFSSATDVNHLPAD